MGGPSISRALWKSFKLAFSITGGKVVPFKGHLEEIAISGMHKQRQDNIDLNQERCAKIGSLFRNGAPRVSRCFAKQYGENLRQILISASLIVYRYDERADNVLVLVCGWFSSD